MYVCVYHFLMGKLVSFSMSYNRYQSCSREGEFQQYKWQRQPHSKVIVSLRINKLPWLHHSKRNNLAKQKKPTFHFWEVPHHGSEGRCTNDRLSSTRGLRGSSDLGGILGGEENLVTPTTPVRVAKPNLHSYY